MVLEAPEIGTAEFLRRLATWCDSQPTSIAPRGRGNRLRNAALLLEKYEALGEHAIEVAKAMGFERG